MAVKITQFVNKLSFSVLVNYPKIKRVHKSNREIGYVRDIFLQDNAFVYDYLARKCSCSRERILKALSLVKLKSSLCNVEVANLTKSEMKRLQLAEVILAQSQIIVCEHFFEGLIYSEKEYFKRFFRNLMAKQGISIILIENDMNFVCETVKQFYLFTDKDKYKLISDFYDDEIYQYVDMPFTVELVKYFESCGHQVDHDVTFNETLKSIYRGVS